MQIAMCTNAIGRSVRLYTEVFGFAEASGEVLYGEGLARMQAVGNTTTCLGWWLLARQPFIQLELFQHEVPRQRPLPIDWRPNDHGWVRWGFAVPDFDDCLQRLRNFGIDTITDPMCFSDGVRRVAFRDPHVGTVVEILEDGPDLPGGSPPHYFNNKPAILYSAVVVPNIGSARDFWIGTLGLEEVSSDVLHTAEMEILWGLPGAERTSFVVDADGTFVEVIAYQSPIGKAKSPDYRLSDQGLQNIALGYRDRRHLDELVSRLDSEGHTLNSPLGPDNGAPTGTYTAGHDGTSVEILTILSDFDEFAGYRPKPASPIKAMLEAITR
ncbi:hypothetical protein AXA44_34590 [Rhodococcus sp. SC4]|nr:hypothetical protein AXA44_34590 [Rhodococcus sp. SC4]